MPRERREREKRGETERKRERKRYREEEIVATNEAKRHFGNEASWHYS